MTTRLLLQSYYIVFGDVLIKWDQLTHAERIAAFDSMDEIKVKLLARIKPDVSMLVGTHTGKRLDVRGTCEKCGAPTNWVVDVMGRVGAYWCGCGN